MVYPSCTMIVSAQCAGSDHQHCTSHVTVTVGTSTLSRRCRCDCHTAGKVHAAYTERVAR